MPLSRGNLCAGLVRQAISDSQSAGGGGITISIVTGNLPQRGGEGERGCNLEISVVKANCGVRQCMLTTAEGLQYDSSKQQFLFKTDKISCGMYAYLCDV